MQRIRWHVDTLHGPNMGVLGKREPALYGQMTLAAVNRRLVVHGRALQVRVRCRQTDEEGCYLRWVQAAGREAAGLIVNPGGWTHTSVALRDAIAALTIPVVEVHLSNIFAREAFRRHSFVAPVVRGMLVGLGVDGYLLALDALVRILRSNQT